VITQRASWIIPIALQLCLSLPGLASQSQGNPDRTLPVLKALLDSSDQLIPAGSSCDGKYGNQGPARISDLLATQLAYLYRGKNVIKGACRGSGDPRCSVTISHAFGEDVSSAVLSFNLKDGKVQVETLSCILTP
jgi:hypothetical protein